MDEPPSPRTLWYNPESSLIQRPRALLILSFDPTQASGCRHVPLRVPRVRLVNSARVLRPKPVNPPPRVASARRIPRTDTCPASPAGSPRQHGPLHQSSLVGIAVSPPQLDARRLRSLGPSLTSVLCRIRPIGPARPPWPSPRRRPLPHATPAHHKQTDMVAHVAFATESIKHSR